MLGTTEIIIVLAIALLVFGPTKLPEIGRQIGSAMRELRKMSSDVQSALDIDEITRYDPPSYGSTYSYNGTSGDSSGDGNSSGNAIDKTKSYAATDGSESYEDDLSDDYAAYHGEPAALAAASDTEAEPQGQGSADAATAFIEPPGPSAQPLTAAAAASTNGHQSEQT